MSTPTPHTPHAPKNPDIHATHVKLSTHMSYTPDTPRHPISLVTPCGVLTSAWHQHTTNFKVRLPVCPWDFNNCPLCPAKSESLISRSNGPNHTMSVTFHFSPKISLNYIISQRQNGQNTPWWKFFTLTVYILDFHGEGVDIHNFAVTITIHNNWPCIKSLNKGILSRRLWVAKIERK